MGKQQTLLFICAYITSFSKFSIENIYNLVFILGINTKISIILPSDKLVHFIIGVILSIILKYGLLKKYLFTNNILMM